ncbi:hypothetical protein AB0G67_06770 [Streptomyces sp. NPDC021056]|uniref:hypothetical protein n=1 Tax=Streptomyces sp. NPDC021056 TaxID=3155012 RepID=UPI0033FFD21D
MLASLTLVLATGVVSPTTAAASVSDDKPTATQQGGKGKNCRPHKSRSAAESYVPETTPKPKDKCKGATGATGATGSNACVEIDSTQDSNNFELRAALTPPVMAGPNRTYAGIRDLTGDAPGPFLWTDLTEHTGYPQDACGISVEGHAQGNNPWVLVNRQPSIGAVNGGTVVP